MLTRILATLALAVLALSDVAWAQARARSTEPMAEGRPLSEWIADLKAAAAQTRNAAAYEIAGLGPAAAPAVPALIEALKDPDPVVRFPVTVALKEIGPAAKAAVPALKEVYENDISDEVASGARRALRRIAPEAVSED